jgi:hypothetical protein
MDEIILPRVSMDTPLDQAFAAMQMFQVAAVLRAGATLAIFDADDIANAYRAAGNVEMARLGPGAPANLVTGFAGGNIAGTLRALFEESGHSFILRDFEGPAARVVTVSEQIAMRLRGAPTICRCRANAQHVWRSTQLVTPGRCNIDDSDVDCT